MSPANKSHTEQPPQLSPGSTRRLSSLAASTLIALCRGLTSTRFVITLCIILLAFQLCIMGIGITSRIEQTRQSDLELARLNIAAIEAREFARALNSGSTQITASAQSPSRATTTEGPPPLKPRPVEAILLEEVGYTSGDLTPAEETTPTEANTPGDTATPDTATPGATTADTPLIIEADHLTDAQIRELDTHIRQGVTAMIAGDMRLCIQQLEAAYALYPQHPALLYYYGMAYDKLLNPNKAREYYTRVFQMREKAGKFFQRASRRLTYGLPMPSDMRGKLAFGPFQMQRDYDAQNGETIHILLPILLAPGEEVRAEDLKIDVQIFDLTNGRNIDFNRLTSPTWAWEHETQDFNNGEENLFVTYHIPALTQEQIDVYGDIRYYGFTAKLYYKGEPLDCISSPSALILHEQRLNAKRNSTPTFNDLLPDDGLAPEYEQALPVSDFTDSFTY